MVFFKKYSQFLTYLGGITAATLFNCSLVNAANVTLGSYTWNDANLPTRDQGQLIPALTTLGSVTTTVKPEAVSNVILFGVNSGPDQSSNTAYHLIENEDSSTFPKPNLNLGSTSNSTDRSGIELIWSSGLTTNGILIFENGNITEPEAFAIRIGNRTSGNFSNFRYEFSDNFVVTPNTDDPATAGYFITEFLLSNFDFNEAIDTIQIVNLTAADRVSGSDGQGFLVTSGGFAPVTGSLGPGTYVSGKFDADIIYVVGYDVPVPFEFSPTLGLLILGSGLGLKKLKTKFK